MTLRDRVRKLWGGPRSERRVEIAKVDALDLPVVKLAIPRVDGAFTAWYGFSPAVGMRWTPGPGDASDLLRSIAPEQVDDVIVVIAEGHTAWHDFLVAAIDDIAKAVHGDPRRVHGIHVLDEQAAAVALVRLDLALEAVATLGNLLDRLNEVTR